MEAARRLESGGGTREARVMAVNGPRGVTVEGARGPVDATLATVGAYRPVVGDRVVVIESGVDVGGEGGGAWVLGVVGAIRPVAPETSDGVRAEVGDDVLTVRGARGEVLFEHDARTGRSVVSSREVHIRGDEVAIEGRAVRIRGTDSVAIESGDHALELGGAEARLTSPRLRATIDDARLFMKRAMFGGERVTTAVKHAHHVADVVDTRVGRIVERAKDVFREVEGTQQVRAGRIRTIAKGAFTVLSERLALSAEDDVQIMGERIELG